MPEIDERTEKGISLAAEMLGEQFGDQVRDFVRSGQFGADLARIGMSTSYTDCWSRDGLDRRSRSLLTIGALIAMRQPNELKNHIRIGLSNGLTVKEIEEIMIHLSSYVGFPVMSSASTAITEVLRESGLIGNAKTSEERGLT